VRSRAFDTKIAALSGRLWWSPAGGEVAIESVDGLGEPSGLHVIDVRTGALGTISGQVVHPRLGDWSPDGRRIAFSGAIEGGFSALYSALAPWTSAPSVLAGGAASGFTVCGVGSNDDHWASFSPSGDALLYVGGPTDTVLSKWLHIAAPDGSAARPLSKPIECREFLWSPDGQTVLFSGRRAARGPLSTTAYTVPRAGGEADLRRLVPNVSLVDWSPDGACVAFITFDIFERTRQLLQVIEPETGTIRRPAMSIEEFDWRPLAR
jgi:dipeptidyl aminopeptidase/acylaminoacyl peptidase